jgi:hypothetical protein
MIKFLGSFIGWLTMIVCCFVGCFVGYDLGKKHNKKDVETITDVVIIHDTIYHTDTIHDTVVKIKRVYIEKEPFKSDIPSTVLFKKE